LRIPNHYNHPENGFEMDRFELTLREATNDDVPTLVSLLKAAFEEYRDRLDPPSGAHEETIEKVRGVIQSAGAALAYVGETAAGCVFYAPVGRSMDLFRLAVLPAHRQRGVGRALIAYVEARTLAVGITRVRLGVRIALPGNRAYYERLGYRFVEARTHAGYTQPTYVILEKILPEGASQ
jgi:GNAT superfamily N-acetyltransferase